MASIENISSGITKRCIHGINDKEAKPYCTDKSAVQTNLNALTQWPNIVLNSYSF